MTIFPALSDDTGLFWPGMIIMLGSNAGIYVIAAAVAAGGGATANATTCGCHLEGL